AARVHYAGRRGGCVVARSACAAARAVRRIGVLMLHLENDRKGHVTRGTSKARFISENWRDAWLFRVISTCAGQQSPPLWLLACSRRQPIRKSGRRGQ